MDHELINSQILSIHFNWSIAHANTCPGLSQSQNYPHHIFAYFILLLFDLIISNSKFPMTCYDKWISEDTCRALEQERMENEKKNLTWSSFPFFSCCFLRCLPFFRITPGYTGDVNLVNQQNALVSDVLYCTVISIVFLYWLPLPITKEKHSIDW